MAARSELSDDGKTRIIRLEGDFDYDLHKAFRDAFDPMNRSSATRWIQAGLNSWTAQRWDCCSGYANRRVLKGRR